MCFAWFSQQTAIISLKNINRLVFVAETNVFPVRYELISYMLLEEIRSGLRPISSLTAVSEWLN
jgi:hypothetical protein